MKKLLPAALCALAFAAALPLIARADDTPGTNPKDVEDLRAIQAKVKDVVKKNMPATVGVRIGNGQGSGVIVNKDGTVLTAGHVSGEPGQACIIILPDGKLIKAKTLGNNGSMDSGMIKITDPAPEGGWPVVEIGTTTTLKAGQWTVALGHPGGYDKNRPPVARIGRVLMANPRLVATDNTLINGDSGGPLFDLAGKLIGIHSRIGMSSSQNIHVPINTYTETWERLAASESWGRNILGNDQPTNPVTLGVTVVESDAGCKVAQVSANSPADTAGIKVGDIITAFKFRNTTQEIKTPDQLVDLMSRQRAGRAVTISVLREGKTIDLNATLTARRE